MGSWLSAGKWEVPAESRKKSSIFQADYSMIIKEIDRSSFVKLQQMCSGETWEHFTKNYLLFLSHTTSEIVR